MQCVLMSPQPTDQHDELDDPSQVNVNPYGEGEWEESLSENTVFLVNGIEHKGHKTVSWI